MAPTARPAASRCKWGVRAAASHLGSRVGVHGLPWCRSMLQCVKGATLQGSSLGTLLL